MKLLDIRRQKAARRLTGLSGAVLLTLMVGAPGALVPGGAYAQPKLPPAAQPGVVDRAPPAVPSPQEMREPAQERKQPELESVVDGDKKVMKLDKVTFGGDVVIAEAKLQKVVEPYLGLDITRKDLARLKYDVTKRLYDDGYILVRVVTPPQDVSDGTLDVTIYAGRIGNVTIQGEGLGTQISESRMGRIKAGEVFRETTVETAVKDVDDLMNVGANLNLRPGEQIGTTDLTMTVQRTQDQLQTLMIDNYGSELTGDWMLTGLFQTGNLWGTGETLGVDLRWAPEQDDGKLWSVRPYLDQPLPWSNLHFELDGYYSEQDIGWFLSDLDSEGDNWRVTAALSGALVNQQQRRVVLRGGLERREATSEVDGIPSGAADSEDDITQLFAEAEWLQRWSTWVLYANLRLIKGVDALGSSDEGDDDLSRANADPEAWIARALAFANWRITRKDFLKLTFSGQYADDTLVAGDLFSIGGYYSVRGFIVAEESGERGIQASAEYSHLFANVEGWGISGAAFFDYGQVWGEENDTILDDELYSAGIGVEANAANVIKLGPSRIRADVAFPLGSYDNDEVDDVEFYLRLQQSF